ncbi:iron-sulfur cluster assembly accessory protein [Peribacillus sp. R9-11]|uniref:HesB/IscA family protein n=1 Tax=Peribacillus sp. R9-11 TaxID=3073271 RepID=UPI00286848EC|nr:iron-sulfur cluster assembly accessory protein [Peribacillus sp. R9-11]WMX54649.1 iron-sulfur cluster assembly accessory protein [Peribacillus sp. R9-11]
MITITVKAQEIIKGMQQSMEEETFLRFGVSRACCNQMNYSLSLTRFKTEQEEELVLHGIKILIDPSDARFTDQTEIDYEGDGFLINNPNPLVSSPLIY